MQACTLSRVIPNINHTEFASVNETESVCQGPNSKYGVKAIYGVFNSSSLLSMNH